MRDHNKLRAFELADEVAIMIYRLTRGFPKDEIAMSTRVRTKRECINGYSMRLI